MCYFSDFLNKLNNAAAIGPALDALYMSHVCIDAFIMLVGNMWALWGSIVYPVQ